MTSAPLLTNVSPDQPVPAEFDLLCESCAYSLVGLMTDRCPECGAPFDPTQLPLARVPWLYRKRLGKMRTHLQTARFIVGSPRVFARELCRPVRISGSDAHAFRLRAIRIAAVAPIAPVIAILYQQWPTMAPWWLAAGVALICVLGWIALCIWMWMATDLPTFIWRGLPGRADDLSPLHHYACAPLLLLPIPAVIGTAALFLLDGNDVFAPRGNLTPFAWLTIGVLLLPVILLMWAIPLALMREATRCSGRRIIAMAVYLPLHWIVMAIMVALSGVALAVGIGLMTNAL